MLGYVIFRYLAVSVIAVIGLVGLVFSQEMPTVPSMPESEEILDGVQTSETPSISTL